MPGRRGRRYLIALAILSGLVAVYAAIGFLAVPRWTRAELTGLVASSYGRTLSIGAIRCNPFTLSLEATDFSLPDADGRPMVSFRRLKVRLAPATLWRLAPAFSDIDLEQPYVRAVVRPDGTLNFAALGRPRARPARPSKAAAAPLRVFIGRLTVAGGRAAFEDDARPVPFLLSIGPLRFELLNFSTAAGGAGSYHLTAAIGGGGRIDWAGTVTEVPLSLRGTLNIEQLSARTVAAYLGTVLPAEVSSGAIALQGGFVAERGVQGVRTRIDVSQAQITGLGVRPRQGTADDVDLAGLTLRDAHIDLEQRSIRVAEVILAGADVRGWIGKDGRLSLLALLGSPAPKKAGAPPGASPSPPSARAAGAAAGPPHWHLAVPDIRLEGARVSLQDRRVTPAATVTLGPLSARITGFDSSPGSRIALSLDSPVNDTGRLRLTAQAGPDPQAASAHIDLHRLDLRVLQPYFSQRTALTLASGWLSAALAVDRGKGGRLQVAGTIDCAGLRTVDDELKQDFIKWQSLRIVGLRYVSSPASLHIERIIADRPYARVIIGPDRTVNVSEALHPRAVRPGRAPVATAAAPGAHAAATPARAASLPMTIGLVRIAAGTADYADFSMQPNFSTGILDLHGTVSGLSSDPRSRATVKLRGKVNRYAPVEIDGVVNLLSASTYTDVKMSFRGLELTSMTPYAVRFAGYKITSGTLDADLSYKVDRGKLNADHRFVINQLQLGERVASPHAVKLPLRLAVALLKDRDGVIRIGLPVTGSLNDPQFRLGPLIGKALVNLLTKAVTAPFALLGRLFGGGPDMNRIDFAPGSSSLAPAAQARLASIAKALAQRPQLRLEVPAAFSPDVDRQALAQRRLRAELIALARSEAAARHHRRNAAGSGGAPVIGEDVLELPAEHFRLLRTAYQNAFGSKAALPASARKVPPFEPAILEMQAALLKQTPVTDADLETLAERRAQAIRAAILAGGGIDAARVAPATAPPQAPVNGRVTVNLSLK